MMGDGNQLTDTSLRKVVWDFNPLKPPTNEVLNQTLPWDIIKPAQSIISTLSIHWGINSYQEESDHYCTKLNKKLNTVLFTLRNLNVHSTKLYIAKKKLYSRCSYYVLKTTQCKY